MKDRLNDPDFGPELIAAISALAPLGAREIVLEDEVYDLYCKAHGHAPIEYPGCMGADGLYIKAIRHGRANKKLRIRAPVVRDLVKSCEDLLEAASDGIPDKLEEMLRRAKMELAGQSPWFDCPKEEANEPQS